ncbi:uncharacterized protein MKK02DRAFT_39722 [Dioszegia hungarica]|uniref:Succinate dehydrogenase subunit C n=1 Tax=Dioszegia hungarica TaxID=4972 RepID=A0AA38HFA5_9TREE|nr:uncharacterized protein MKK02DRAFT_39722 [Dioszegia hungarica]KAI9639425.1 hypothetical protein MKK02DRAFT_39722 [Dioszegia hungarica]
MIGSIVARRSLLSATGLGPCLRMSVSVPRFLPTQVPASRRLASSQTTSVTAAESVAILNAQREKRPNSPHFTIYQPQITWLASIANRVTGSALSVALYAGSITYLLHPYFPAVESANLVQMVHDLPVWVKGSAKLLFAVPFTFHTFNGIRHLAWDVGYGLSLKGVYVGGYGVLALTAVSSIYLAFFV